MTTSNPTAAEIMTLLADWREAEDKWAAALNRPNPDAMPFAAADIDARECRPLRDRLAALSCSHLRTLTTPAPAEAVAGLPSKWRENAIQEAWYGQRYAASAFRQCAKELEAALTSEVKP